MAYKITFPAIADVRAYRGRLGTGKTQRLVERVAELVAAGESPEDILVLCARTSAVAPLRDRISERLERLGMADACPHVLGIRDAELALLAASYGGSQGNAARVLGRGIHMLSEVEEHFFHEDMLVCGIKRRRLREMLRFFARGVTEFEDRDPHWIISDEERTVRDFARGHLVFMGSLHPCEVSNAAVTYLERSPEVLAELRVRHVVVDDYQSFNRASQLFANMLAGDSLTVAFDPYLATWAEDPYPYAAGLHELFDAHPNAACVELIEPQRAAGVSEIEDAVLSACGRVSMGDADGWTPPNTGIAAEVARANASDEAVGASASTANNSNSDGDVTDAFEKGHPLFSRPVAAPISRAKIMTSNRPEDEFQAIAARVSSASDPAEVAIVAPNGGWERGIVAALTRMGLHASPIGAHQAISGDIRNLKRSHAARVYEALRLVADPQDACAWRCWCGFGDYLGLSNEIDTLMAYAGAAGRTLPEALGDLGAERIPSEGMRRLKERYRAGVDIIRAGQGLAGDTLIDAVTFRVMGDEADRRECAQVTARLKELAALGAASERAESDVQVGHHAQPIDASAVVRRIERAVVSPVFAPGSVRVCSPEALIGQDPEAVIVAGFVNGFYPQRACFDPEEALPAEQDRMLNRQMRRLYGIVGSARSMVVFSTFEHIDLEDAERLNLKIDRIQAISGRRVCRVSTSVLLEKAGCTAVLS